MTNKSKLKWLERIESAVNTAGLVSILMAWGCVIFFVMELMIVWVDRSGWLPPPATIIRWLAAGAGVGFILTYACHRGLEKIERSIGALFAKEHLDD